MVESVDKVAEEHERNVPLVVLLLHGLRALDAGPSDPAAVAESFLLKLLSLSGFHPALTACAVCGAPGRAAVVGRAGRRGVRRLRRPERRRVVARGARAASRRSRAPTCRCVGRRATPTRVARREAREMLYGFTEYHLERRMRSVPDARAGRRRMSSYLNDLDPRTCPRTSAIVMDGNGRWAKQRGLPRTEGHGAGEEALLDASRAPSRSASSG